MESEEAGGVAQWDSMSSILNKGERERENGSEGIYVTSFYGR